MTTLLIISHVFCGILAYGMSLGFLKKEYPEKEEEDKIKDIVFSIFFGLCGIGGLIGVYFGSKLGKHGFRFK